MVDTVAKGFQRILIPLLKGGHNPQIVECPGEQPGQVVRSSHGDRPLQIFRGRRQLSQRQVGMSQLPQDRGFRRRLPGLVGQGQGQFQRLERLAGLPQFQRGVSGPGEGLDLHRTVAGTCVEVSGLLPLSQGFREGSALKRLRALLHEGIRGGARLRPCVGGPEGEEEQETGRVESTATEERR